MKNTPFIAVTSQPVPYHADTTAIFNTLCLVQKFKIQD